MKNIIFTIIMLFSLIALFPADSAAQTGHGMMRRGHMGENGHMMGDQGMMREKGFKQPDDAFTQTQQPTDEMMMQHRHMMNGMMEATQDMAIMMRQMSVIMGNVSDRDSESRHQDMQTMSEMMRNMSREMNVMSDMMIRTAPSEEDIRAMKNRLISMQEQLWKMRR